MITLSSPGRAEVLGNHTDYNDGLALSLAIDRKITASSSKRNDRSLKITAKDLNQTWHGNLDSIEVQTTMTWVNYIIGVFLRIEQTQDIKLCGLEMIITSSIPIGAGLSSSAALEAVSLMSAYAHNKFEMDELEMAKICQWAEHEYSGVRCGLLDQMSVLASKKNHLNSLDFKALSNTPITFPDGYKFIIVNTESAHSLADGEYNERRESCERAAKLLGKNTLREITLNELEAKKDLLDHLSYKRALHVIGEIERVKQGVEFLKIKDIKSFGNLMFQSHESSIQNFENSCKELNILVHYAKQHPSCFGARLSGGGFGGATINLVKAQDADKFEQSISEYYENATGITPTTLITNLASGALEHFKDN